MAQLTTPGQLLIDQALPPDMRRGRYDIDKKSIKEMMTELLQRHPDQYREVTARIMAAGHEAAQTSGHSLSLESLVPSPTMTARLDALRAKVLELGQSDLPDEEKEKMTLDLVAGEVDGLRSQIVADGDKDGNPLILQARSGSRGNANNVLQAMAGDMLVADHRDRPVGVPVLHGYGHGLDPVEYWASSYGARKGAMSTKMSVADSGFLTKQLVGASHRLVVTEPDCGDDQGIAVPANDADNVGSVLAKGEGNATAGTILSAGTLKRFGDKEIRVRSPLTCKASRGICARCAGARFRGGLPKVGDNVGIPAAQALGERVSQGLLGAKHQGGMVAAGGVGQTGFDSINSLVQVPKGFAGSATLATMDGVVTRIRPASQGGTHVTVGETDHYIPPGLEVSAKAGDEVEAGDSLSSGVANPAEVTQYKGIGEGRKHLVAALSQALSDAGAPAHRRNIEVVARGLVNHVKITAPEGLSGFLPDDVVTYDQVRSVWEPREGASVGKPSDAKGRYLERPAGHYTLGTRVTPSVIKQLSATGYNEIETHPDPPPFEPVMVRAMENAMRDPNWMTRLGGSYLTKGFSEAVHRGRVAPLHDTSWIPSLAEGMDFGRDLTETGEY
jgi:DNA-directed RNA polymerase subunit beta'